MSTVEPREHEEGGTKYSRVQCEPKISVGVIVLVRLNTKESQTQKNRKAQPGDQLLAVTLIDAMVRNVTSETMVAQAVPSVTPFHAAEFLHKTECFCFEQQQLEAREDLDMPLRFIIDSQIPEDVKTLTLSYTLYDVTEQIGLATN